MPYQRQISEMQRAIDGGGAPWAARAWAPTIRNLAPAADNADSISTKSRFIDEPILEHPSLKRQLPHHGHTLARCEPCEIVIAPLF